MDDLLAHIAGEVALEGVEGASISRLFYFVDCFNKRQPVLPLPQQPTSAGLCCDAALREYVWSLVREDADLVLCVLDKDELAAQLRKPSDVFSNPRKSLQFVREGSHEELQTYIRMRCHGLPEGPPPTHAELYTLGVDVLYERFGERVRVCAESATRTAAVYGDDMPPSVSLYTICEQVARYRSEGITQIDLGKQMVLDPRAVFHFVKQLEQRGLIVKMPAVAYASTTQLVILARFAHLNSAYAATRTAVASAIPYDREYSHLQQQAARNRDAMLIRHSVSQDLVSMMQAKGEGGDVHTAPVKGEHASYVSDVVRCKISDLLAAADDQVMMEDDLINILGMDSRRNESFRRAAFRALRSMAKDGYLELMVTRVPGTTKRMCVKLLKPYLAMHSGASHPLMTAFTAATPVASAALQRLTKATAAGNANGGSSDQQRYLADLPIEFQLERVVRMSGRKGMVIRDLTKSLNNVGIKFLGKIVERMCDLKNKPPGVMSLLRVSETFGKQRRFRYFVHPEDMEDATPVAQTQPQQQQEQPSVQPDQQSETSTLPLEANAAAPPAVNIALSTDAFELANNTVKMSEFTTVNSVRRMTLIVEMLRQARIINISNDFIREFCDRYAQLYPDEPAYFSDRRTIMRLADTMAANNLATLLSVGTPTSLSGSIITRRLLVYRHADGSEAVSQEELQQFKDNLVHNPPGARKGAPPTRTSYSQPIRRVTSTAQESEEEPADNETQDGATAADENAVGDFWLTRAQENGYLAPRMLRARKLHLFLYRILQERERTDGHVRVNPALPQTLCIFSPLILFRSMTVSLFLQIIGYTEPLEGQLATLREHGKTSLTELSLDMRRALLGSSKVMYRFRRTLAQLLHILWALRVVVPVDRVVDDNGKVVSEELVQQAAATAGEGITCRPLYALMREAPLLDYSQPLQERRVLYDMSLGTKEQAREFWSEVEIASFAGPGYRGKLLPIDSDEGQSASEVKKRRRRETLGDPKDPLRFISHSRNWLNVFCYTQKKRAILNAECNRSLGKTPLNDAEACARLAEATELPVSRVKQYFQAIETEHEQRKLLRARSAMERRDVDASAAEKAKAITSGAAGAASSKSKRKTMVERLVESRVRRQKENRNALYVDNAAEAKERRKKPKSRPEKQQAEQQQEAEDDDDDDDVVEAIEVPRSQGRKRTAQAADLPLASAPRPAKKRQRYVRPTSPRKEKEQLANAASALDAEEEAVEEVDMIPPSRLRYGWSEEQDDLLMIIYVVMAEHCNGMPTPWAVIVKAAGGPLADVAPDQGRRRFYNMMQTWKYANRTKRLQKVWRKLYAAALEANELPDQRKLKPVDFELMLHVRYLQEHRDTLSETTATSFQLPATVTELHKHFVVTPAQAIHKQPMRSQLGIHDQIARREAAAAKQELAYWHAQYTDNSRGESSTDANVQRRHGFENLRLRKARHLLKMICLTPEPQYDARQAFEVLQQFPEKIVTQALQDEHAAGTLVRVKGRPRRMIPGRGMHLTDKFMAALDGLVPPRIVLQAVRFTNMLHDLHHQRGQEEWVFDPMINEGGMMALVHLWALEKVSLQSLFPFSQHWAAATVPSRTRKRANKHNHGVTVHLDGDIPHIDLSSAVSFTKDTNRSGSDGADEVMTDGALEHLVWDAVEASGAAGLDMHDLKKSVPHPSDEQLVTTVARMCAAHANQLVRVGFRTHRYVTPAYMSTWLLDIEYDSTTRGHSLEAILRTSRLPLQQQATEDPIPARKCKLVLPRLWIGTTGEVALPVLRSCMNSVGMHIAQHPGIYLSDLFIKMRSLLLPTEVVEVLEELLRRRAITSQHLVAPSAAKVFGSKRHGLTTVVAEEHTVDEAKITAYFPSIDLLFAVL